MGERRKGLKDRGKKKKGKQTYASESVSILTCTQNAHKRKLRVNLRESS